MSESEEEILKEMLRWLKFSGIQQAKEVVDDMLTFEDNERKERDSRIVYELTDGEHSQRDIAERISYSRATVGNWQEKWSKVGIVDKNARGRYEHLISLEELGLECPPIPDPDEEQEESESDEEEAEEVEPEDEQEEDDSQATLEAVADGED